MNLPGAKDFAVQVARDAGGKDLVGDLTVQNDEAIVIPLEVTWKSDARVKTSRQHATDIIAASKTWRKANGGKGPKEILYYGAFAGTEDWVSELKATLGYNTLLPEKYPQVKRAGLYAHASDKKQIEALAKRLKDPRDLRVLSFGDEIDLGGVNAKDANVQAQLPRLAQAARHHESGAGRGAGQSDARRYGEPAHRSGTRRSLPTTSALGTIAS